MATLGPQQFCVRWNSYHTNLQTIFPKLLTTENFVDVTLACENRQIKCHKVVLSACSTYFERLLIQNPCKHPIIFMKDMRFSEMQSLVDFMYKGEVNVTQDDLPSLLKSAEALQIRGLCGADSGLGNSGEPPAPSQPANNSSDRLQHPGETKDNSGKVTNSTAIQTSLPGKTTSPAPMQAVGGAKRGGGGVSPEATPTEAKRQGASNGETKQETVEEDGLYYGEMENDEMECGDQTEDEMLQGSGGCEQPSTDFAIANVTCEYDTSRSASPASVSGGAGGAAAAPGGAAANDDHNYNASHSDSCEPPAFIIKQVHVNDPEALLSPHSTHLNQQLLAMSRKLLASSAKPIQIYRGRPATPPGPANMAQQDLGNTKRIRRSEVLLKQAADCVSRGQTFQTVSDQFNIPISTIRFFMARKGILPRRKRGRSSAGPPCPPSPLQRPPQADSPTQPPYHMAHYKLPDMDLGRVS